MFEFQMDIKDSESVNRAEMDKLGIVQVQDARFSNPKFRVESFSPKNIDEALEYVGRVFYFMPLYVRIDGKKVDPTKVKNKFIQVIKNRN